MSGAPLHLAAGFAVQGAVLAAWAGGATAHGGWVLALAGLVALAAWQLARRGPARLRPYLAMAAGGGAGMVLGAWAEAHPGVPACLCCRFAAGQPVGPALRALLGGWSSAAMLLLALPAAALRRPRAALNWARASAPGMLLGMATAAWASAPWVRRLAGWKLEAGHLAMLAGMLAGCWAAERAQRLLRAP